MIPQLNQLQRWTLLFVVLSSAFLVAAFITFPAKAVTKLSPFVYVDIDEGNGHGSGTMIGGNVILTAAHVTNGAKTLDIKTEDGYTYRGELLWQNTQYDVALIRIQEGEKFRSVPLSCRENYVGQNITIIGNPLGTREAKSWGRVSGTHKTGLEDRYEGMWKQLVILDITAAPGVSGAGILNDAGELVGILVAGSVSDRGTFGYSYGVPASLVCQLLIRA